MPKLVHYRSRCIGCGSCVLHASKRWSLSSQDGKADLIASVQKKDVFVAEITLAEIPENELAAKDCPVSIIKLS